MATGLSVGPRCQAGVCLGNRTAAEDVARDLVRAVRPVVVADVSSDACGSQNRANSSAAQSAAASSTCRAPGAARDHPAGSERAWRLAQANVGGPLGDEAGALERRRLAVLSEM
jgi:hypothetical protein